MTGLEFSIVRQSETLFCRIAVLIMLSIVSPLASAEAVREVPKFQDCDSCPAMVRIPGDSYLMGSPHGEEGRSQGEAKHMVTIAAFAVGAFEITFEEWAACVAADHCNGKTPNDNGWGRDNRPVINVTREEAKNFVSWLNTVTSERAGTYRLLSEAEWEYVARAQTLGPFHFGDVLGRHQANYRSNFRPHGKTKEVGQYDANFFGLHDVHGNVAEWVEDCWHDTYDDAPQDGSAWTTGCPSPSHYVVRGGAWNSADTECRSAHRLKHISVPVGYVGFRVAKTCLSANGTIQCEVAGVSTPVN